MKYQALKQLKTKSKLLKLCNTMKEAEQVMRDNQAEFVELSYIGGFPVFRNNTHAFSIQGMVEPWNIVCSLSKEDVIKYKRLK